MRSLNPSCKLIGLILLTFALAFAHNPLFNVAVFILSVIMIIAALISGGIPLRRYLVPMIPIAVLAVGMFFTGYRFTVTGSSVVNLHAMHLANIMNAVDSRVWNGLTFSSRVLAYSGVGFLFAYTTDRIRMIRSFQQQLHVPQIFAYGLLAAWGLLPHMVREYKRTRLAFAARGMKVSPVSPALITTLLVKTTRWSEALSVAMESKGFSGDAERSVYEPETVRTRDVIFAAANCLVMVLAIVL